MGSNSVKMPPHKERNFSFAIEQTIVVVKDIKPYTFPYRSVVIGKVLDDQGNQVATIFAITGDSVLFNADYQSWLKINEHRILSVKVTSCLTGVSDLALDSIEEFINDKSQEIIYEDFLNEYPLVRVRKEVKCPD